MQQLKLKDFSTDLTQKLNPIPDGLKNLGAWGLIVPATSTTQNYTKKIKKEF